MMEIATNTIKFRRLRYCSVPSCEYHKGTIDKNIGFFRPPPKGDAKRKLWIMMLFSTPGLKMTIQNLNFLCQLHFKPEDVRTIMVKGIPHYKLKKKAIPLPIKKPIDEFYRKMNEGKTITPVHKKVNGVENITLVDINKLRKTADTVPILDTPDQFQQTTPIDLDELNECGKCTYMDEQLQRAKEIVRKLLRRVNELKRSVHENDCEKCELCCETLDQNGVSEHFCEDELWLEEKSTADTNHSDSDEYISERAEFEQLDLSHLPNEPNSSHREDDEENIKTEFLMKNQIEPLESTQSSSILLPDESKVNLATTNATQNQHPNNKFYQCGKCNQSFETPQELGNHLNPRKDSFARPKSFECYICKKYESKTQGAMRKHIKTHRVKNYNIRKCQICNKRGDWTIHLCGNNTEVQCEYCSKRFNTTTQMQQHLDKRHKTNRRLYRCAKCPKFFEMVFFKDYHQASHTEKYECNVCGKKYKNSQTLYSHKRVHSSRNSTQKSFLCEGCGKAFPSTKHLETHKKSSAHSEPTVQCPSCPKKFFHEGDLKRHSSIHNENNYVCEHCGKCLVSIDGYRIHKKRHNRTEADRQYACKLCPLKFFGPKDLKKHEMKHIGIKQFHCEHCDSSYKYKGDLIKHFRTHFADDKIYECSMCPMRFKYANELQKHSFEHYKEENAKNQNQEED